MSMTLLYAVTEILNTVFPDAAPSAITAGGSWPSRSYTTDDDSNALRVLDRVSQLVHMQDIERLWTPAVTLTAADNKIEFASGEEGPPHVRRVRGAGKDTGRRLGLQGTLLKDLSSNSTTFTTGVTVVLDYVQELEFHQVDTSIQPLILAIAKWDFYRNRRPDNRATIEMLREDVAAQARGILTEQQSRGTMSPGGYLAQFLATRSEG